MQKTIIFSGHIPPKVYTRVENTDLYVTNISDVAYLVKAEELDKIKVHATNIIMDAYDTRLHRWTKIKYKLGTVTEVRDKDF